MSERVVDDSILEVGSDGPRLIGAVCGDCGCTTFPAQSRCARCSGTAMERTELPTTGTLWAFTVQHFAPKPPFRSIGAFEPYGVGYVDLGPVIVETRLTVDDVSGLRLGQPARLCLVPAYAEEGTTVLTYAFEPVESR